MFVVRSIIFLINPNSGKGNNKNLDKIALILKRLKIKTEFYVTKSRIDLIEKCKNSLNNYDLVVAVGGDGTLQDVIEVVYKESLVRRIKTLISLYPSGTGNVFAKEFNIPKNPKDWCKRILTGKRMAIDIGRVDETIFFMMAGVGFDAKIVENTENWELKKFFGKFSYIYSFFKSLKDYKANPIKLKIDDYYEETGYGLIVSNTEMYGAYFRITPNAFCNDGYLDCLIYKSDSIFGILNLFLNGFLSFLNIKHRFLFKSNFVRYRCKKITLSLPDKMVFHVDGDIKYSTPQEISIIPSGVKLLLPLKSVFKKNYKKSLFKRKRSICYYNKVAKL